MLTSIRSLTAATLAGGLALSATPAFASETDSASEDAVTVLSGEVTQADFDLAMEKIEEETASKAEGDSGFEFSGNVALVSEYRFRGADLSGGELAVQGGVDIAHSSGFYIGAWGSSLDEDTVGFGSTELDIYGGYGGSLSDAVSFDVGAIVYLYPDAGPGDFDYWELYGSLGFNLGPAEATVGVAYAFDQASLADEDNLYIYTDIGFGIPNTPLTVTGHLGYTDGILTFTNSGDAWDWSIGVEAAVAGPISVGVAYIGVEDDIPAGAYDFGDSALVFTLSASI